MKPKFASSSEIEALSKHFVMVNTQDDEEPSGSKYMPDGGYVPRILFLGKKEKYDIKNFERKGFLYLLIFLCSKTINLS